MTYSICPACEDPLALCYEGRERASTVSDGVVFGDPCRERHLVHCEINFVWPRRELSVAWTDGEACDVRNADHNPHVDVSDCEV